MTRVLFFICLLTYMMAAAQPVNDWENPQLIGQNKENAHATFLPSDRAEDVKAHGYSRSPYCQSLNGARKYVYADRHAGRPQDF